MALGYPVRLVLTHLLALLTLAAGMLPAPCRCAANRPSTPPPVTTPAPATATCCCCHAQEKSTTGCCHQAAPESAAVAESPCCATHAPAPSGVHGTCCSRGTHAPSPAPAPAPQPLDPPDADLVATLPALEPAPQPAQFQVGLHLRLLPPPDLVTTLQRLTI